MAESAVAQAVKPLFSAEDISRRVDELASAISAARLRDPIVVAVLKGSFIFAADLIRALHRQGLSPEIDFIFLASYGAGTQSEGKVRVLPDFAGFSCPPVFVVGYGMDLANRYRELPFIGEIAGME